MKFGAEYQEALRKEEYPSQWIESAISYKKLKKCIKRVREELLSLGLDHHTLEALWQHGSSKSLAHTADADRMMNYQLTTAEGVRFVPKLTIALDPHDGSPMDAWLSPETRRILQKVGTRKPRRSSHQPSFVPNDTHQFNSASPSNSASVRSESAGTSPEREKCNPSQESQNNKTTASATAEVPQADTEDLSVETIEIPLTSDSEFFQVLRRELRALEKLQLQEQTEITSSIESLSHDLRLLKMSRSKFSRAELEIWREIFRLYIESEVFMSNNEHDAGVRSADKAAEHFRDFNQQLSSVHTNPRKPRSKEARVALDRFVVINSTLLRLLKFQELNRKALGKILKKFDKKTSLHAISDQTPQDMLRTLAAANDSTAIVSPHDLARSTAFAISQELLSLIPQLNDYLCPICSWIAYKPVRLRCNHVFCIRCMIRMQKDEKDECPLCRKHVVLEACEENLDLDLKKFLKQEFKSDVDAKKKENELLTGKELFGESYTGEKNCTVM